MRKARRAACLVSSIAQCMGISCIVYCCYMHAHVAEQDPACANRWLVLQGCCGVAIVQRCHIPASNFKQQCCSTVAVLVFSSKLSVYAFKEQRYGHQVRLSFHVAAGYLIRSCWVSAAGC